MLAEVFKHCPRFPSAHQANLTGVDVGPDEGHAATIAEGSNTDVTGSNAKLGSNGFAAGLECVGEEPGGDGVGLALHKEGVQGCGWWGPVTAQMEHLSEDGLDW